MSNEQRRQSRPPRSTGAALSTEEIGRLAFAERGDETDLADGEAQSLPTSFQPHAAATAKEESFTSAPAPEPVAPARGIPRSDGGYGRSAVTRPSLQRPATKTIRMQTDDAYRLESICRVIDMSENKLLNEIVEPVLHELEELLRREGRMGVFRYLEMLGARRPRG